VSATGGNSNLEPSSDLAALAFADFDGKWQYRHGSMPARHGADFFERNTTFLSNRLGRAVAAALRAATSAATGIGVRGSRRGVVGI
jgi:hypothetical protein